MVGSFFSGFRRWAAAGRPHFPGSSHRWAMPRPAIRWAKTPHLPGQRGGTAPGIVPPVPRDEAVPPLPPRGSDASAAMQDTAPLPIHRHCANFDVGTPESAGSPLPRPEPYHSCGAANPPPAPSTAPLLERSRWWAVRHPPEGRQIETDKLWADGWSDAREVPPLD